MFNAIRVAAPGGPGVLQIARLAKVLPGPTEVLIQVASIGINPVETYIRSGIAGKPLAEFPYTPGNDCAGIVESVGEKVTRFHPGDRVYTLKTVTGAYAEYTVAEETYVQRIPDGVSFHQAAALPVPYFTAYRALFQKLHIRPGKTLLIHGATGGVGLAAMQMARAHGLTVIGTAGTDAGEALVAKYAHAVVRHGSSETADRVLAANGGSGVHYILEMLANHNLSADMKMLAQFGSICVVGSRGDVSITPRDLMRVEGTITAVYTPLATVDDMNEAAAYINAGLVSGVLQPVIGTVYAGLSHASDAHAEVIEHAGGSHGKIILDVSLS